MDSSQKQMTVLQVVFQPFGILNALRDRFVVPFAVTALLRIVLFAPKDTFVYQTFGAHRLARHSPSASPLGPAISGLC